MLLADPTDQASGLRRLFAGAPAFRAVGVLGPDARRNARASLALASALGQRGAPVLLIDEAAPPYNVGGNLGLLARRGLQDATHLALPELATPAGEGLHLIAAQDGARALAALSEEDILNLPEQWPDAPPEWMLINSAAERPDLAVTADIRVLAVPGDRNLLAETYALMKAAQTQRPHGVWAVLVVDADAESAERLFVSLHDTAQRFLDIHPGLLGHLPRARGGAAAAIESERLADALDALVVDGPVSFAQYWQRMWLFSRMQLDLEGRKKRHAGRRTR